MLASIALWAVAAALPHAALPPETAAEQSIYQRIERLRNAAQKMRLDGQDADWKDFFATADAKGDAGVDAHRDLIAAAIAPTETDLWVMLRTAGTPSQERYSYYLFLNLYGDRNNNVKIELVSPDEPLVGYAIDDGRQGPKVTLHRARAIIRRVVELRLPYSELANVVSDAKAKLLTGKEARPWVRVECQTWDGREQRVVDYGPCVASFRLAPTPYPLDEGLPERQQQAIAIDLPTRGTWYVVQGSHSSFSHKDIWACDLTRIDSSGYFARVPESTKVEDYWAYNEPVYAPVAGRVLRARGDVDDSPPRGEFRPGAAANQVSLGASGYSVDLVHFKRDGVDVKLGEAVAAGQRVGFVGNSGASDVPHVHVAVWDRWRTTPLAFRNVRVGLNDASDDPWVRTLPAWEPRKGYFIAPQKAAKEK